MSKVEWIKIRVDMFEDEKMKLIQCMPEGDALQIIWIRLLAQAGKINDGGYVYLKPGTPYNSQMLSIIFNQSQTIIDLAIRTFQDFDMIEINEKGIRIVNWEKHQNVDGLEKIREQNRERKRRQREKQRLALPEPSKDDPQPDKSCDGHVTVTPSHATDIDTDLDKEIENDDCIDELKTTETDDKETKLKEMTELYMKLAGRFVGAEDMKLMSELLQDHIPMETILEGIHHAFKVYKLKHKRDGIKSFKYCDVVIRDLHCKRSEWKQKKDQFSSEPKADRNLSKPTSGKPKKIPKAILKQLEEEKNGQSQTLKMDPQELAEKQARIQKKIHRMNELLTAKKTVEHKI